MTRDKAQKRAIRASVAQTGEGSNTARHEDLDRHLPPSPEIATTPKEATSTPNALPPRATEPGMSDEAIRRRTGRTWDEWFVLLDGWRGAEPTHPEIARHLAEEHGLSGWWAQSVTVGYERARGMRAVHQLRDGFSVNASKTFPMPVDRLFAAFAEETSRDRWLEPGTLQLRTVQTNRSARFDVPLNGTRLQVNFIAKGDAKSSAALQHVKLPAHNEIETWRGFWKERLSRLAILLNRIEDGAAEP